MKKFAVAKPAELKNYVGDDLALSDWVCVTQDMIDLFAQSTGDHQWIHVDAERASRDTPFKSTIAHGFLSLSLAAGIPVAQGMGLAIEGMKMGLNYGLDKVRFLSPVPVGSEVRIRTECINITEKNPGQFLIKTKVTMEIKGVEKPAYIAETLAMYIL